MADQNSKQHMERRIPRMVSAEEAEKIVGKDFEEEMKDFKPGNVTIQSRPGTTGTIVAKPINEHVTLRNFQHQRELLNEAQRRRKSEIESVKAEMRKLTATYEKLERELFVIQVKEEAARAAIRTMEDRGVNE